ncbi:PSD1 and planctomycete cytochrome C domain-containing protein [Lentisphaera marina]|uniref:PSD1 and planctomycete cytochrome C domain-containing protein n=1 Tax=Lentisphaera marina TaxID=1111041 RepID=UPI0023653DBE|nr:PSD1 and planctomycete cytochrome C domain-containing protein [Lentisphaera marina]MDD7984521.1 PSD1 and planctomycete cytochrome C domain-containing protein [Lentisphaera marina]
MKYISLITAMLISSPLLRANEGIVFFEKKIRPALEKYCYRCHSDKENKVKGGLVLDSKHGLLVGGDSGPAIVPGKLDDSELWLAITYEVSEMPPKEPMPDSVIADFKKWILMGAPDPREQEKIVVKSTVTRNDIREGREFWSMQKPKYSPSPSNNNSQWNQLEIDRYVYFHLQENNLQITPEASSQTLVRRLYFDLIGLPPSPGEINKFNTNYEKNAESTIYNTVDELLKSPHFGEKWGRHWLDIARYAESTGQGRNMTYPHAWRYRDYVIESFNQDKPYDQFIREQIAGDLIKTTSDQKWAENLIATSFLAMGSKALPEDDQRKFNAEMVDEQIDLVTRGIMGISVACARCHDHKFDAIPQSDYYALAGIFQSTKTFYGTTPNAQNKHPSTHIKLPVYMERNITAPMSPSDISQIKEQLTKAQEDMQVARMARRNSRNMQNVDNNQIQRDIARSQNQYFAIQEKINSVDSNGRPIAYCMGTQPGELQNAKILERGEVHRPGQEVARGFIKLVAPYDMTINQSSNGRLELAQWITSKDNPLTARVMVNRIWMKLMGQAIVRSTDNFGLTGTAPTNQELLDFLALKFMTNNWSLKGIIKNIVLSRAYRSSSEYNANNFKIDPDNEQFWRIDKRRIEAESIRDAILQISGEIIISQPIGSQVAEKGQTTIGRAGQLTIDISAPYRSIYLPVVRDFLPDFLKTFDFPESMTTASKREINNNAAQALYMLNNDFVITSSELTAQRLIKHNSDLDKQIQTAFIICLARQADSGELIGARQLYQNFYQSSEMRQKTTNERKAKSLAAVVQALFASSEFRYLN